MPQGSNLGPLFFLIMINDLPESIRNSQCALFADDFKLYKEIKTQDDVTLLQSDIDRVFEWSLANKLSFNVDKCFIMSLTRKKYKIISEYTINNTNWNRKKESRDLVLY